jgi:hypothetical protein
MAPALSPPQSPEGVIDGDLVASFLSLDGPTQAEILTTLAGRNERLQDVVALVELLDKLI